MQHFAGLQVDRKASSRSGNVGSLVAPLLPERKKTTVVGRAGQNHVSTLAVAGGNGYSYHKAGMSYGSHPIDILFDRMHASGFLHDLQLQIMFKIRRILPIVDNVFMMRRALEGPICAVSDSDEISRLINEEFIQSAPVGFIETGGAARGLNIWLDGLATAADEYGMGVGEMLFDISTRQFDRFILPDMRAFSLLPVNSGQRPESNNGLPRLHRLMFNREGGGAPVEVRGANIYRLAFRHDGDSVWPLPMMFGLECVAEIVMRMYLGTNNLWMRSADPSNLFQLIYDKDARLADTMTFTQPDGQEVTVDRNLVALANQLRQYDQSKYLGYAANLAFQFKGAEMKHDTLFNVGESLAAYFREHDTAIKGEIVDASQTPHFLYANGTSSSDGGLGSLRSQVVAGIAQSAASQRRGYKLAIARSVINTWLLSINRADAVSQYELMAESVPLTDQKIDAEARKINSEADLNIIQAAHELFGSVDNSEPDEDGNVRTVGLPPDGMEYIDRKGVLPNA